jgi:hypothetical protein
VAKAAHAALKAGLEAHRANFLPIHFQYRALQRYVKEYRVAAGKQKRGTAFREKLAAMSVQERADFFQPRTAKRRWAAYFFGLTRQQRDNYLSLSASERKAIAQQVENTRRPAAGGARKTAGRNDPSGNIPLVESGRSRQTALFGYATVTGSTAMKSLNLASMPHYITINREGQINKVEAIQATIQAEEIEFSKIVDKVLGEHFNRSNPNG